MDFKKDLQVRVNVHHRGDIRFKGHGHFYSSSYGGDFSNFETHFFLKLVTPPLLWYMEEMYGATKRPHQYSKVVGTIELDDSIQEFKNWSDMQQMRNPQLFTPFMAWKGLFQHLKGLPMDDYHEFKCAHEIQIEE